MGEQFPQVVENQVFVGYVVYQPQHVVELRCPNFFTSPSTVTFPRGNSSAIDVAIAEQISIWFSKPNVSAGVFNFDTNSISRNLLAISFMFVAMRKAADQKSVFYPLDDVEKSRW